MAGRRNPANPWARPRAGPLVFCRVTYVPYLVKEPRQELSLVAPVELAPRRTIADVTVTKCNHVGTGLQVVAHDEKYIVLNIPVNSTNVSLFLNEAFEVVWTACRPF